MVSSAPRADHRYFRFGVYEFDSTFAELRKSGTRIPLQPQPAGLLTLLLTRAGEVVDRETIRQALWGDGTMVDFEHGVNRCVRQLRSALSDDPDAPRYIRTIPRRGYSFIGEVSGVTSASSQAPAALDAASEITLKASESPPSIAVLPFTNLSSVAEDEYFSDGLAEEIINALAQVPDLKVIARTSAFAFKGRNEDIRGIAETLGVSNVVEGSVRRSGNRVRVTAQLIHAADGTHLSSKRYDRELTDIFAVQDEISADIAEQLQFRLIARKRSTTGTAAYRAFLEGRYHWAKFTPDRFRKAFECFQRAAAIDPEYGPAYAGMAAYYLGMAIEYGASPRNALPKAAAVARRALELDETNAEAHALLGDVAIMLDFDWTTAERHFSRARELNSGTQVRIGYALWFLLPQERMEEVRAEFDQVTVHDPLHLGGQSAKATALLLERNYDAAVEESLRVLDLDPSYQRAIQNIAYIRAFQSRFEEARAFCERLIHIYGRTHGTLFALGTSHAVAGDQEAAHRVLREMKALTGVQTAASGVACIYALLEERDAAFEWIDLAVEHRDPRMLWIRSLPWVDALRSDPRYDELLLKMNLAGAMA
jgi:serine/threonine-protein kinase